MRVRRLTVRACICFLLSFCAQPIFAHSKDCSVDWTGLVRTYPWLQHAVLQTPTRNPDRWKGRWNYEYVFEVARATIDDFSGKRHLFAGFEKLCVFELKRRDGLISSDGVGGLAFHQRFRDGGIRRHIYYNPNQHSDFWSMRLFLHELGHHIASYVDGTHSNDRTNVGFRHNMHVRQRMAEFWAGAILYRLNEREPGRFELASNLRNMRESGYTSRFISSRNRAFTLREGWEESKYGDTPWPYYGTYDAPWVHKCPHQHPVILASQDPYAPVVDI